MDILFNYSILNRLDYHLKNLDDNPMSEYREDIVDILQAELKHNLQVKKGRIFGHPGFSIQGRFFCFAYQDGLAMKLSPGDYEQILKLEEAVKFSPGGSPMGTWVALTYPEAEDYLQNWDWLEKSMAYIVTDEAAPPKKRKRQK